MGETELREALAKIEDWCIDSLDDIDAKHGSIQRLVLAVIPTTAANALASTAVGPEAAPDWGRIFDAFVRASAGPVTASLGQVKAEYALLDRDRASRR